MEEEDVIRLLKGPGVDEPLADAERERPKPRLGHPIDPVVVDLGERRHDAGQPVQLFECGEPLGVVGQAVAGPGSKGLGLGLEASPTVFGGLGWGRQAGAEVGDDHRRLIGPGGHAEVVHIRAEVTVPEEEGLQLGEQRGGTVESA